MRYVYLFEYGHIYEGHEEIIPFATFEAAYHYAKDSYNLSDKAWSTNLDKYEDKRWFNDSDNFIKIAKITVKCVT